MKFNEVFPSYEAGLKIARKNWGNDSWIKKGDTRYCPGPNEKTGFEREILADDWYVVDKQVKDFKPGDKIKVEGRKYKIVTDHLGLINIKSSKSVLVLELSGNNLEFLNENLTAEEI